MAILERLLSPQSSSRPKQEHQNNRPNNTPADPCDVRVSRLPFENLLMNGHQECLSLTSILQVVASFCQIFSAATAATGRLSALQRTRARHHGGTIARNKQYFFE